MKHEIGLKILKDKIERAFEEAREANHSANLANLHANNAKNQLYMLIGEIEKIERRK